VVFGEYILSAAQVEVGRWNQRLVGMACLTAAFLIHGCALKWGLRLQNFLGFVKLAVLVLIAVCGFVSLILSKLRSRIFRVGFEEVGFEMWPKFWFANEKWGIGSSGRTHES